ncbi:hypothetical protein Ahy_B03g068132 [Arachis hypogaea]|uniref:Uncharacterized protein n=1 Tax=Arachis hypogaea TaxID=3818 RepID=A0A445A8V0_ARAHY|nr:hypothetical protein Ahy_B03g068132 [Arachis hypogaea]
MTLQFPVEEVAHFLSKKEADSIPFSISQDSPQAKECSHKRLGFTPCYNLSTTSLDQRKSTTFTQLVHLQGLLCRITPF